LKKKCGLPLPEGRKCTVRDRDKAHWKRIQVEETLESHPEDYFARKKKREKMSEYQ